MKPVAALFVDEDGIYPTLPDVDAWGVTRDARRYAGNAPVVAHPPCERWGRFARQGGRKLGDDDGCFASALASVRRCGGVLEHPYGSHAFRAFNVPMPVHGKGWTEPDAWGGRSVSVDQAQFGHPTRKRTWLYCVRLAHYPDVPTGDIKRPLASMSYDYARVVVPARFMQAVAGVDMATSYRLARWVRGKVPPARGLNTQRERAASPPSFARLLVRLARTVNAPAQPWMASP